MNGEVWKVLVVDDSPEDRAEVRRLLLTGSDRRYKFLEAETGAAAVRLHADADCVVLDYRLPDMDAPEVLAALRRGGEWACCPVVVLTGTAGREMSSGVLRAGAMDYLGKGWMNPESLTRAVENAVERFALLRERGEQEERLRLAAEAAEMGAWECDPSTGAVRWSARARQLLGLRPGEAEHRATWQERLHPDDRGRVEAAIARANDPAGDGRYEAEYRVVLPDGRVRWLADRGRVHFADGDGGREARRAVGVAVDVTGRRQAEEELRQSEAFNRSLMEGSPDCVKVLDIEGRLQHMNGPGLCLMEIDDFGPLRGRLWWELWPAESREQVRQAAARAAGGEVVVFDAFCPTAKGTAKWWEVTVSPVGEAGGRPARLLSVSRDISERKRAEEALRASEARFHLAVRAVNGVVWEWDLRTGHVFRSDGLFALTGVRAEDAAPTREWWAERIHPDDLARLMATADDLMATAAQFSGDYRVRHEDGHWVDVWERGLIERDAEGRPVRLVGFTADVTDRKRAEQQLRESEERFRALAEHQPTFVWETDAGGAALFENERFYRFTGLTHEQVRAGAWLDVQHPEDAPRVRAAWQRAVAGLGEYDLEARFREEATGQYRWFRVLGAAVRDGEGRVIRWVGTCTDIDAGKRAAEALRAAHDSFRHLVEGSPFGVYAVDADFRLVQVSAGAQRVFAHVRPLLGRDFAEVLRVVWPEPFASEAIALFRHTLATGEPYHSPSTVERRADIGEVESYDWRIKRVTLPDGRPGVVCHFYDLSERQRYEEALRASEARFRHLAAAVPQAVWVIDPASRPEYVNDVWRDYFGLRAEACLQGDWSAVVHPDDRERAFAHFASHAARGEPFQYDCRLLRADGEYRWHQVNGTPVRGAGGAVERWYGVNTDIHDRQVADEAVRVSEARYRALFYGASVSLWEEDFTGLYAELDALRRGGVTDFRGYFADRPEEVARVYGRIKLLAANEVSLRLFEVSGEGELSASVPEFLTEESLGPSVEVLARIAAGERDITCETAYRSRGGRAFPALFRMQLGPDEADRRRVSVSIIDLTESRRAQELVRHSEERFRRAADATGALIYEVDLLRGGARAEAYGLERLVGADARGVELTSDWWHARIHPGDLPGHLAYLQECVRDPGCHSYHAGYRARHSDGSWRDVEDTAQILREADGRPARLVGTILDVTERKRAEEALRASEARFRSMANTTPALIWTADPSGNITFHNQRWLDYTGLDLADNVSNWPKLVLHPDDFDRCVTAWAEALRSGQDYQIEVRNRRRDGEYRWFLTRATPIRDAAGRIAEWYGSTTDIHDRKVAEEALEEAGRRKDELLAMLAHELRNPLAPIRNAVFMLRMTGPKDAVLDGARDMIDRQVVHLTRLVDDLLDVSRVSRGKVQLQRGPLELAAVVQHAVETSRPLIDARRHELSVSLPEAALRVDGDFTRLAQVVSNLLNNAAKYTDEGGRIWLSAEAEGGEAVVRVRDNGRGIDPAALPSLFDLFYQVDRNLDRADGGLGIGLSLVKSLVEMHGGRVSGRSAGRGRGSEFTVRLPLPSEAAPAEAEAEAAEAVAEAARLRVLVVDDNRDSADSMALVLRIDGHDVRVAHDGRRAVELALAERPEAVLLDIGLPHLDGYQACRAMRHGGLTRALIVAMTGYGQDDDRARSEEAGFDVHLVKPVDLAAVRRLLAER